MSDWPPYRTLQEWLDAGYLQRDRICNRQGCGLPVTEFYLPGDLPFRVDPVTRGPHIDVCSNKQRVRELQERKDGNAMPALDWKQRQSGER